MRIEVTLQDIQAGKRMSALTCPVACALKRYFPSEHIIVGRETLFITGREQKLPPNAIEFIRHYDHYEPVMPIEFEIKDA